MENGRRRAGPQPSALVSVGVEKLGYHDLRYLPLAYYKNRDVRADTYVNKQRAALREAMRKFRKGTTHAIETPVYYIQLRCVTRAFLTSQYTRLYPSFNQQCHTAIAISVTNSSAAAQLSDTGFLSNLYSDCGFELYVLIVTCQPTSYSVPECEIHARIEKTQLR
ncbi:hypothetical protein J6590_008512 [Homalodisca vitripennis]|nr:hypothetical protein J6590_008512 [Homalodisca vitripennis]